MANEFGLFFKRDATVIRLPVNPTRLPTARDNENDKYNVLGIGPIMVPRIPALREVTISSYFPGKAFPGVLTSGEFQPPEFYLQFFESAMREKAVIIYTPVRYYEDGTPFMTGDAGFSVLVTQFNTEERGGETGDFYFDLTLTEYRDYAPQTLAVQQNTALKADAPATVAAEPAREIPAGQLYVGAAALANGAYYYSSYGDKPAKQLSGRRVLVSRILTNATRPYPIHVTTESGGALGWVKATALQVVSSK